MTRLSFLALALALGLSSVALATPGSETNSLWNVRAYGLAEQFTWKEKFEGETLLKETGPLFGVGVDFGVSLTDSLWLEGRGEAYVGEVNYDGALQAEDGSSTPYSSDTSYGGVRGEALLSLPRTSAHVITIAPRAGLGGRFWTRTLDTKLGDDIGFYGYEEYWTTLYGVLGARLGGSPKANQELFVTVEARLPFWNRQTIDLSNVGGPDDVELEPGHEFSWYFEAGYNVRRLTVSAFYETLEFGQSELDASGFFQPESSASMAGGKLGANF